MDTTAWVSPWEEATGGPEMFQGWVFTPRTIKREDRALLTVRGWTLLHSLKITEVPVSTLYMTSHLPKACVLPRLTETWPGRHSGFSTPGRVPTRRGGISLTSKELEDDSRSPRSLVWDTYLWSLETSHQPWCPEHQGTFPCRRGQENPGSMVASISEGLRVPRGLPFT